MRLLIHHHTEEFPVEQIISQEIDFEELCSVLSSLARGEINMVGKIIVKIHNE